MDLRRIASRIASDDEDEDERLAWWNAYLEELHDEVLSLSSFLGSAREQLEGIYDLPPEKRRGALIAFALTMKTEVPNHKGILGLRYLRDTIDRETKNPYYRVGEDAGLNQAAYDEMRRLDAVFKPFLKD